MTGSLGLESGTVRVVPYDTAWPTLFRVEADRVREALPGLPLWLEHVGSTAVPGVAAKPIIDILAGRPPGVPAAPYIAALGAAGYEYRGEQGIPGRAFFRRGVPRSYHIHLAEVDSQFWRDHLAFRDHLRSHPEVAAEYVALKESLAAQFPRDREAYISGKGPFILQVLARATRRSEA